MMKTENIFYTSDRAEWRRWLAEHFETETEVWFVFPLKNSGQPGLSYNDAVEEALCFGWIDSIYHAVDEGRALRFTPRRVGSPYSRPNIERLIWLDKPSPSPTSASVLPTSTQRESDPRNSKSDWIASCEKLGRAS